MGTFSNTFNNSLGSPIKKVVESEWDYEGIMTVGENEFFPTFFIYGWVLGQQGDLNPSNPIVTGYNEITAISANIANGFMSVYDENYTRACNTIEINGVEYTGFDAYGDTDITRNPFPAAGETCTIKIK